MPGAIERGAEPILQVPISHLRGNGTRCKCCALWYKDPEAFVVLSQLLVRGTQLEDVLEEMVARGHDLTIQNLSNHRNRHMNPAMWQLAAETAEFQAIAAQALGLPTGDLATMELKLVSAALLEATKKLDRKKLASLAKDHPADFIELINKHARALAQVQASDRQAQLNEAKLKLEKLRVDQQTTQLVNRGLAVMETELSTTPEGRKVWQAVANLINAPKP